jgi:hypothetical protein
MASEDAVKNALQGGFRHKRTFPALPSGYDWDTDKEILLGKSLGSA